MSWSEANTPHQFEIELVDEDGHLALDADGNTMFTGRGEFETSPSTGLRHGTELGVPMVVPVPPLQLDPGRSYTWRVIIDGESKYEWTRTLHVRRQAKGLRQAS